MSYNEKREMRIAMLLKAFSIVFVAAVIYFFIILLANL